MVRQILTFHLAAILLFSNVGIPFFKHICHTQGKSWSSIFIPAKSCCTKKKLTGTNPCHAPKNDAGLTSRPCCENHQDILQLSVDYTQSHIGLTKYSPSLDFLEIPASNHQYGFVTSSISNRSNKAHGPPMTLHGRSLLISQQIFRC